jgi:hypothetical protein
MQSKKGTNERTVLKLHKKQPHFNRNQKNHIKTQNRTTDQNIYTNIDVSRRHHSSSFIKSTIEQESNK